MRKKMYWGIASLILIIGVVGIYFMLQPDPDVEPEKVFIAPSEADLKNMREAREKAREANKPPPGASPNGHWHGDEWHDESHVPNDRLTHKSYPNPSVSNVQTEMIYPMPDDPVSTLREYLEKRGHWSAKWIPEFPPDDEEAARIAYNCWVLIQHEKAGNEYFDGPALIPDREISEMLDYYKYLETPRAYDMYKLSWSVLSKPILYPENFNIYGFDKAKFDAERQARIESERQARLEENK